MKQLANPTIFFVRHGQNADNKADVLPGWKNDPLDAHGKQEAEQAANKLDAYPISHIYTSPLSRAKQTASAIASKTGAATTTTNGLLPWNYGDIAGKPNDEKNQQALRQLQESPETPSPNGESFADYTDRRFFPAVQKMRDYVEQKPNAALVAVTHSRNLLALRHALGDKSKPIEVDKSEFPNASVWKAEFNDSFPNGYRLSEV